MEIDSSREKPPDSEAPSADWRRAPAEWLQQDYKLTGPESAILLGATIEYQISEVADRNVGIVAKMRKKYLPGASR